jgi:hypothetical protein
VYLEGGLQRALNPIVFHRAAPDEPAFDGPAPMGHAEATPGAGRDAVLDPFSVYQKGEALLRGQLKALSAWHLVNIIEAYRLSDKPAVVLNRLPPSTLIDIIVSTVASR